MDILKKILFVALLSGLVGGEVLRVDNGQSIAITFFDVGAVLFVGVSLLINLIERTSRRITNADKYALWFVGIGLVSLLLQMPSLGLYPAFVSFLYALRFGIYTVGMAWSVQLLPEQFKKKIPYLLLATGTLLALVGFVQYAFYPSLRNLFYAGWDPHLYRIFSTFLDPNFMGLLYVLGTILGISILFEKYKTHTLKYKIFFAVVTLIQISALFLTYSRGAYLAFVAALVVMLWRGGYKKFILVACGVLLVLAIAVQLISPRSEGTKLFRTASVRDRVISLSQVTTIIAHHSFLGVGFDAYRYAQQHEGFLKANIATTHSGAGTDNSFLFVFATTGIVGLVAYLLMTWNILKVSYAQKTLAGRSLFVSYIALMLGSFFVNALFYPFLLVWIWILVGL